MDPLMTNAGYTSDQNSMYIFAGIVADPIYNENMTDEEFYGHLAHVIGHEISHAFDPIGSEYDKDGNLKNWWTEEDQKAFNERAEKLVKYYDTITIWTGQNVSGELDQTELVADMGSMKAMLTLAKAKKDFDYEAFFKAYAELWRTLASRENDYFAATQDPHPAHYLRTNVVVQQFEEFYETFGVKEGDGMYLAPEDRVAVW
jgi:putative endopeptidase